MKISHATDKAAQPKDTEIETVLARVAQEALRRTVDALAQPRHYTAEAANNQRCAEWIASEFERFGYIPRFQGSYRNVVATPADPAVDATVLVGAHYDSVPGTPGADDNASAVAALLECARIMAGSGKTTAVAFVAFNREEDGLLGSSDFVQNDVPNSFPKLAAVHVLEMVGYCRHEPGSQRVPTGLPIRLPTVGDFIGLVGNRDSADLLDAALTQAATYLPTFPAMSLTVPMGLEKILPVLSRSDHAPFWQAGIPALMWTDTAEFRNPHYHQATDTPETLDYAFLQSVTQMLIASVAGQ